MVNEQNDHSEIFNDINFQSGLCDGALLRAPLEVTHNHIYKYAIEKPHENDLIWLVLLPATTSTG
jgi:hypothetical protein